MECHRCPYALEVAAGHYAHTPFKKTPCARCKLTESPGRVKMYDENSGEAELQDVVVREEAMVMPTVYDEEHTEERQVPWSYVLAIAAFLMRLPPPLRDIICGRMTGLTYVEIARQQNSTLAAVELRLRRAMNEYPFLATLFPEKVKNQGVAKGGNWKGGN